MRRERGAVPRYTPLARANHWLTAALLILLALSGLSMFHPGLFFLSHLFGGGEAARAIHPWFGVVLLASFALLFFRFVGDNLWSRDDTRWMGAIRSVMANEEEKVPEVDRYNAGQKLVFWGMTWLILILFFSGLVIWDAYFATYTAIETKRIAVLVHSVAAAAIIWVWIVHVYASLWVRGTVRGMMRGSVTAGWAWRHHRKWLRAMARGER
ncbi:MAG: formate dehydrogenase subunit gamma [Alphaproteobacteria bacterium]|nr:formate dehydrogenase subunit gamma [Alphaproteobacteria bacterium]